MIALVAAAISSAASRDVAGEALIHADAAHAAGFTGKGVTIAILDTGIDNSDSSLASHVVAEHCIVPPSGCPNGAAEEDGAGSAQDNEGHGNEIAGVVSSTAPDASLVIVKVADANGRTTSTQIAAGLDWLRTSRPEVKVVNISLAGDIPLSGDCSNLTQALHDYSTSVTALHDAGVAVFAAAGNNGRTNGLPAPACFPGAIAVGAVYARSVGSFTAPNICVDKVTYANELACFSNTSSRLALLAVGAPVDTVALGGVQASIAGTSAAAAQASGVAALVLQASPGLTPDGLLGLLQQTGTPVRDPRSHVVQPVVPRIDAAAALGSVLGHAIPLLPPPSGLGPALDVEAKPVAFGRIRPGGTARRRLVVRNAGLGTLTVRTSTTSQSVQVAPSSLSLPTGEQTVTLTFRPRRAGVYRGTIRIATDDPSHRLVRIPFTGRAA